ncbi:MAG: histidinol dehydrogenase, partial [Solobacterium sp.]|nr:histidinol dehydrogenase [Solobacterium sp.]
EEEIEEAYSLVEPSLVDVIKKALVNIREYHEKQKRNSWFDAKPDGTILGQKITPLASVGVYVPGGKAAYPSSVLMNIMPAKVAGVEKIVMVTPPDRFGKVTPATLVAAHEAGATHVYKVGGAQAIAALAYGTETIAKVDKIVGPGNIYVAAAKKLVYGKVDIDMIAGPSEILVIADEGADPRFVAADLLSQAEHDPMASAVLLTTSEELLARVNEQLRIQTDVLPKKAIVEASLRDYGTSIICGSIEECIEFSNAIAPEHLELMVKEPMPYLNLVKNAGSVFLGYYTCESIGDYFGGTNHVLPTSGTARFSSALGVDAFIKKSSFLYYTEDALRAYGDHIVSMAEQEELQAHANAAKVRMK